MCCNVCEECGQHEVKYCSTCGKKLPHKDSFPVKGIIVVLVIYFSVMAGIAWFATR